MKLTARKIILICLILWGTVMLCLSPRFLAIHRESKSVDRTFDQYTSSLVGQRFEVAYQLCGTQFRSAMPYDRFIHVYESLQEEYGPLKSVKRVAYEVRGSGKPLYWRAVVDADFAYEKKTIRFELVFHKEADRWVLFGTEQL